MEMGVRAVCGSRAAVRLSSAYQVVARSVRAACCLTHPTPLPLRLSFAGSHTLARASPSPPRLTANPPAAGCDVTRGHCRRTEDRGFFVGPLAAPVAVVRLRSRSSRGRRANEGQPGASRATVGDPHLPLGLPGDPRCIKPDHSRVPHLLPNLPNIPPHHHNHGRRKGV